MGVSMVRSISNTCFDAMSALIFRVLKRRGALSLAIGSLRGRTSGSFIYPACLVPSTTFSTNGKDDQEPKQKKTRRLKRHESDKLIVFVNVPPLEVKEEGGSSQSDLGDALNSEKRLKKRRTKSRTSEDSNDSSVDPQEDKKKSSRRSKKIKATDDTTMVKESAEQGKKKKQPRKRKQSINADQDIQHLDVDHTADSSPEVETKKKRGRRKKSTEQSDEDIKSLLLGPFVPFEGSPVNSSGSSEGILNQVLSMDRQDLPEGRFYHVKSSTDNFSFPSVTTILDNTMESSSYYRLLKWRLKLTGEHGAKGFDTIRKTTLNSGHNFHKVEPTILTARKLNLSLSVET